MAADIETRFKELEAKVQELTDREALRDLRYRYHEYTESVHGGRRPRFRRAWQSQGPRAT